MVRAVRAAMTERLPVAFLVFQTGNRANGGVESITQILERTRRIEPIVITQLETPVTERWRRAGLEVHVRPVAFEAWSEGRAAARHLPRNNLWMAQFVRRRGVRVVHANDIRAFLNLGPGARLGGARVALNVRDVKPPDQPYSRNWRLAASLSDVVIGLSREMADDLRRRLGHDRIAHVYSAVDFTRMYPLSGSERALLRAQLGLPPDRFVLAYVAAFNPKKAQLAFLEEGLAPLVRRCPSALVVFVGDFRPDTDEYARSCLASVERQGFGRAVHFAGYDAHVERWYRGADAIVLASRHEGLARCMIEGLACGTPVVSFAVCSAREILEEHDCGIVVELGDYDGLAGAAAALAIAPAESRAAMSARGVTVTRALFDPADAVAAYEDTWLRLTGGADA